MDVKSFRDLMVWQKAMEIVEECYRLTSSLPRNEEFGLKSQMRRAAGSIPSNSAEDQGQCIRRVRSFGNLQEQMTTATSLRRHARGPGCVAPENRASS